MNSTIDLNEYRDILPLTTKQEFDKSFDSLGSKFVNLKRRSNSKFKIKCGKNLIIDQLKYLPIKTISRSLTERSSSGNLVIHVPKGKSPMKHPHIEILNTMSHKRVDDSVDNSINKSKNYILIWIQSHPK